MGSIKGKVIEVLAKESGTSQGGKEWEKQVFVIETQEQYPVKIAFTCFGKRMDIIDQVVPHENGDEIEVFYNVSSREYNGKWFHNVDAWKVEVPVADEQPVADSDEPF